MLSTTKRTAAAFAAVLTLVLTACGANSEPTAEPTSAAPSGGVGDVLLKLAVQCTDDTEIPAELLSSGTRFTIPPGSVLALVGETDDGVLAVRGSGLIDIPDRSFEKCGDDRWSSYTPPVPSRVCAGEPVAVLGDGEPESDRWIEAPGHGLDLVLLAAVDVFPDKRSLTAVERIVYGAKDGIAYAMPADAMLNCQQGKSQA
jgi:hypothetical protein